MSEVTVITSRWNEGVQQTLKEAASAGFETVIVFGFVDGRVHIKSSGHRDVLKLMGALEAAKQQLWAEA